MKYYGKHSVVLLLIMSIVLSSSFSVVVDTEVLASDDITIDDENTLELPENEEVADIQESEQPESQEELFVDEQDGIDDAILDVPDDEPLTLLDEEPDAKIDEEAFEEEEGDVSANDLILEEVNDGSDELNAMPETDESEPLEMGGRIEDFAEVGKVFQVDVEDRDEETIYVNPFYEEAIDGTEDDAAGAEEADFEEYVRGSSETFTLDQSDGAEILYDEDSDSAIVVYDDGRAIDAVIDTVEKDESVVLYSGNEYLSSADEAVEQLRDAMVSRQNAVQLYFSIPKSSSIETYLLDIWNRAIEHTGNSREGDAILWDCKQCRTSGSSINAPQYNRKYVSYHFTIDYYTDSTQEERLQSQIESVTGSLGLSGKSNYQKVKEIHDYIANKVTYDQTLEKHAAYDALISGSAVCQGYTVLFYRMALEAGLDARAVPSIESEEHIWNIVRLGGKYYNVDVTWDDTDNASVLNYNWFLLCDNHFTRHTRDEKYASSAFYRKYPMSSSDYSEGSED
ncbi:MAG: hypothetical protein IJ679_07935 [Lachnospiraceae bacterium]|nr:hypothetical protein [Lachnospiraceae bacterium]